MMIIMVIGSCSAAGYSSCCVVGSCKGEPPNCYCDSLCYLFDDCCDDATELMCTRPTFNITVSGTHFIIDYEK